MPVIPGQLNTPGFVMDSIGWQVNTKLVPSSFRIKELQPTRRCRISLSLHATPLS
jgi:hypothetical protein